MAFPAEMPHAQHLQKIIPVAEGDHAHGPSCSAEREYCPRSHKGPAPTYHPDPMNHHDNRNGQYSTFDGTACEAEYSSDDPCGRHEPWQKGTPLTIVPLSHTSPTHERTNP